MSNLPRAAFLPGDRVTFGPPDRPLSGEIHAVSDGAIIVVCDDFMGRRVPFTVTDLATVRRVPMPMRRSRKVIGNFGFRPHNGRSFQSATTALIAPKQTLGRRGEVLSLAQPSQTLLLSGLEERGAFALAKHTCNDRYASIHMDEET